MPKDTIRVQGGGDLWVQVTKTTGAPVSIVQLAIDDIAAVSSAAQTWSTPMILKAVKLSPDDPVPPLRCTLVELESQATIATRSLSWEQALALSDWTPEASVDLTPTCTLFLKLKWVPQTSEQSLQEKAALKIQTIFRGNKARQDITLLKVLNRRKVLSRRGVKSGSRHYLISAYEGAAGIAVELNPADDPEVPLFTVLSEVKVPAMSTDELFDKLQVDSQSKLSFKGAQSKGIQISGNLVIKFLAATGLPRCFIKVILADSFATSLAGPPWSRPVQLADLRLKSTSLIRDLTLSVNALETRSEVCKAEVPWEVALLLPYKWTEDTTVSLANDKSLTLSMQWQPASEGTIEEEEAVVVIQSAWKAKAAKQKLRAMVVQKRKLVGRTAKKQGVYHYIISVYEQPTGTVVELCLIDQSGRPSFEPTDIITVRAKVEMSELMSRLAISGEHKMAYS
jgi:hypothetical protein